jgi:hypothetical protein
MDSVRHERGAGRRAASARRWLVAILLVVATVGPTAAHHVATGSADGIPIPSLTHGQMTAIADHRAAILDLADREPRQDETFFRLHNFINIQYAACLWGLVPGSLADEGSPFNECSHAYLSATQTLLLHMRDMPGDRTRVRALLDRISLEMLTNNASLVVCRYSGEPFNTADVISPRWTDIPFHAPSLWTLSGATALLVGGCVAAGRWLRAPSRARTQSRYVSG